jgi:hypothetical protein
VRLGPSGTRSRSRVGRFTSNAGTHPAAASEMFRSFSKPTMAARRR